MNTVHGTEPSRERREHLQGMMLRGEQVQWTGTPLPRVRWRHIMTGFMSGVVASLVFGPLAYYALETEGTPLEWMLFSPFLLGALYMLCTPLRFLYKQKHTCYALTNVRAIVLERKLFGRMQETVYYLTFGMVQARKTYADGSGCLVFRLEPIYDGWEIRVGESHAYMFREHGFLEIADVEKVEALLDRLIAELPDNP